MSHPPPNPERKSTYDPSTRTTKTTLSNKPSYTHNLAGPSSSSSRPPLPRTDAHNTYYAEGYRSLNPLMENFEPRPSFSLARTFPHNVRWGAGKKMSAKDKDPKVIQDEEKTGTETAPWDRQGEVELAAGALDRSGEEETKWEDPSSEALESEASTRVDDDVDCDLGYEGDGEKAGDFSGAQHRQVDAFRGNGERIGNVAEEHAVDPDATDPPFNTWAFVRLRFQRPLAEWLGTTIFTFIGISGTLAVQTSSASSATALPLQPQSQYWTWGFATMLAIYISGGGSGAFLNPALTILLSVFRGFPSKRVPVYIISQICGAFTGALLAFVVYRDGIAMMSDGGESTATAFYTQPQDWMSNGSAFLTEMLGTAVVGISILALGDSGNSPPGAGMHAFVIGLLITTVTMALGQGTGGCFNPARDLGPRMAAAAVGYDDGMWTARDWWWLWGAWGATITGALLGGFVYDVCVFKGGESPVNYSWRRWKVEGLKEEKLWTERLGMREKTVDLQKRLEEGAIEKQ